jgi:uncharacterized protein (DUF2461 family)
MSKKIRKLILELTAKVGPEKTICPSEVARALAPEAWRELMNEVRENALRMHEAGEIVITQKGEPVRDFDLKGPIRLRIVSKKV